MDWDILKYWHNANLFFSSNLLTLISYLEGMIRLFFSTFMFRTTKMFGLSIHLYVMFWKRAFGIFAYSLWQLIYDDNISERQKHICTMKSVKSFDVCSIQTCGLFFILIQMGSFQLVETITGGPPSNTPSYPINTSGSAVIAFDISSTCQSLAFGDSSGLHFEIFSVNS